MSEAIAQISGEELTLDEYIRDFNERFWSTANTGGWKLERRQTFRQPESASWTAFDQGDWDRALRLIEERRPEMREYYRRIAEHGFEVRRLRVVERPLSPYLIWELNSLRLREEFGDWIRVIDADRLTALEENGPLPELFVIGPDTVYEVVYDDEGIAVGAIRSVDAAEAKKAIRFIRSTYDRGEALSEFFDREVAGIRPPGTG
ncbi:hypothetical protein QFW96_00850 [Saccharopolyspora sp. TS4A08]|uniref:DUF6879 domain-containing protein n=1 Tax=Saccharopolyspora ipomoeae TaxID=3042027 RepID=A0ABT6PGK3_9PSEU|nr:DUF6879 family protein [Saccharopolyspora sp. TS4A08]MDI2027130.1 hypothetical protein [Saccharopolyspora sp. TS4A08]